MRMYLARPSCGPGNAAGCFGPRADSDGDRCNKRRRLCVSPRDAPPLPDWRFHTPRALMTKQGIRPRALSWLPALPVPLSRSATQETPASVVNSLW